MKANQWQNTRRKWLKNNPPNHQGYYECYICQQWVPASEVTIDHVIPRSRAPHLARVDNNLKPCCWDCNMKKGSTVGEDN